jgi:hypothetical protein
MTIAELKAAIQEAEDHESVLIKHDDELLAVYGVRYEDGDLIISADPNDEEGDDEE